MCSLDFIQKTDEYARFHPVLGHRSIWQRTHVSRDLATVRTVPSHRTQPCPGSATWRRAKLSKQWSLIPVVSASGSWTQVHSWVSWPFHPPVPLLSRPTHFQRDHLAQKFPRWLQILPSCISYCCGDLHHSWFSIVAYGHLRRSQHVPPTLPASQLRAGPQLPFSQRWVQRPFLLVDPSRPTWVWHLRSDTKNQSTQVDIDHRALDASNVDVQDPCQPHSVFTYPWTARSHSAVEGVRGLDNSLTRSPSSPPSLSQSMSGSSSACGPTWHSSWATSTPPWSNSTTLHSRPKPSLLTGLMVCPSSATQTPGLRSASENPASCCLRLFWPRDRWRTHYKLSAKVWHHPSDWLSWDPCCRDAHDSLLLPILATDMSGLFTSVTCRVLPATCPVCHAGPWISSWLWLRIRSPPAPRNPMPASDLRVALGFTWLQTPAGKTFSAAPESTKTNISRQRILVLYPQCVLSTIPRIRPVCVQRDTGGLPCSPMLPSCKTIENWLRPWWQSVSLFSCVSIVRFGCVIVFANADVHVCENLVLLLHNVCLQIVFLTLKSLLMFLCMFMSYVYGHLYVSVYEYRVPCMCCGCICVIEYMCVSVDMHLDVYHYVLLMCTSCSMCLCMRSLWLCVVCVRVYVYAYVSVDVCVEFVCMCLACLHVYDYVYAWVSLDVYHSVSVYV